MTYVLHEFAPTRSQRCLWTLNELDVPFETVSGREQIHTDALRKVHPQGKLPALTTDGKPLFESAAICTYLADCHPEKGLIPTPGSYERGLHEQWTAFTLAELECHLWTMVRNTAFYPEEKQVRAVVEQNTEEAHAGLRVFQQFLGENEYLTGDRFQVTDIIASFALNWARRSKLLEDYNHISAYLQRLFQRPHCTLNQE